MEWASILMSFWWLCGKISDLHLNPFFESNWQCYLKLIQSIHESNQRQMSFFLSNHALSFLLGKLQLQLNNLIWKNFYEEKLEISQWKLKKRLIEHENMILITFSWNWITYIQRRISIKERSILLQAIGENSLFLCISKSRFLNYIYVIIVVFRAMEYIERQQSFLYQVFFKYRRCPYLKPRL